MAITLSSRKNEFSFTALDGKDKWTAYKFTKNVYDIWMPIHLKRICLAIDELPPDIDFELSQSASFPQELESQSSQQSIAESTSMLGEDDSQSSLVASRILPFLREPSENTKSRRTTVLRGRSAKAMRASQALREVLPLQLRCPAYASDPGYLR